MELHIHTVLPKERTELAHRIAVEIERIRDQQELISYLENQNIDVNKVSGDSTLLMFHFSLFLHYFYPDIS